MNTAPPMRALAPTSAARLRAVRRAVGCAGRVLLYMAAVLLWAPRSGQADDGRDRPQDELWFVSARHGHPAGSGEAPELSVACYEGESRWQPADLEALCRQTSPDQIMVIYIHGNRMPSYEAAPAGMAVYRVLAAGVEDATPIRFVIWSWPSAQVRGPARDARIKANRTDAAGYCLAWVLSRLPETQRVSLLGHSFGARIATGAMHLISGGELCGWTLPSRPAPGRNIRLVMLAGALHNSWLRPGGYHELAVEHLDFLLNLYNSRDPVLRFYPRLYKRSRAVAIGYRGMYTGDLGELAPRIAQQDVCCTVQRSHDLNRYLWNACLDERMRDVLFWRPVR